MMGEGREEIERQHAEAAETSLGEAQAAASKLDARRLLRIQQTRAWLSVIPFTVNGMELGAQEWRDSLLLRYGIKPPDLPSNCDGCGETF